jgi:hypothetical protein
MECLDAPGHLRIDNAGLNDGRPYAERSHFLRQSLAQRDAMRTHAAEDAVIVEGRLAGTHKGAWMGIPPTGKPLSAPFSAVFTFNDDDRVKSEIVYYDRMTLLGQLGVLPG